MTQWHHGSTTKCLLILVLCLLSSWVIALQPQLCAGGVTYGEPTAPNVRSCVCYSGRPPSTDGRPLPKLSSGEKTVYNTTGIITEGCEKITKYTFGPDRHQTSSKKTIENKLKGLFLTFDDDILIKARFWQEAKDACNSTVKLSQDECESYFHAAIW